MEILQNEYFQYFDRSKSRHDRAKIGLAGQHDRPPFKYYFEPCILLRCRCRRRRGLVKLPNDWIRTIVGHILDTRKQGCSDCNYSGKLASGKDFLNPKVMRVVIKCFLVTLGNCLLVCFFAAEGCDPNQQLLKAKGKTAMHAAAAGGYVDIMACLRLVNISLLTLM